MTAPRLSDHALLRFLERAGGFDVEAVRKAVEAAFDRAAQLAAELGERDYTVIVGDHRYFVRDGVIVTLLPAGQYRPEMEAPR